MNRDRYEVINLEVSLNPDARLSYVNLSVSRCMFTVSLSTLCNDCGPGIVVKRLRKLEEEVRRLKENSSEKVRVEKLKKKKIENDESSSKSLYALFANKGGDSEKSRIVESLRMEDQMVYKELSLELALFVKHLYKEGYFVNANFLPNNKFDITCFVNSYGRDFIRYAVEKFGKDNQEIVCSKCALKSSCKFVNQSVWKGNNNNLNLAVVMRVILLYAMESVPPQLVAPDEIKASVSVLLKETTLFLDRFVGL
ncbi:uncharacterized protein LOC114258421 [Camellia sinensis]|uniref:uncharacterized protein LOC114258421 n=1 Tax=Camellia sinensis TaxID=4442 RepID=UPI001035C1A9|nr:uncharacterized protein LOC114258421 [Camellia sinensis]